MRPTVGLRRAELGQHGLAGHRCLADRDARHGAIGQEDVDARAEPDEADALACLHLLVAGAPAHDAPGDEAGDLDDSDGAVRTVDDEAVAFVLSARLVEFRIEELALRVGDAPDPSA